MNDTVAPFGSRRKILTDIGGDVIYQRWLDVWRGPPPDRAHDDSLGEQIRQDVPADKTSCSGQQNLAWRHSGAVGLPRPGSTPHGHAGRTLPLTSRGISIY